MLDSIMDSVKKEIGTSLSSKIGLNKEQAKAAIESTGSATMEVVSKQLVGGDMSSLMNLFSSKPNNAGANGIQKQIGDVITKKLSGKMGFTSKQIQGVITLALPIVMNYISKKNEETPDDDDSPLRDIFGGAAGKLLKGGAGGILGKLF